VSEPGGAGPGPRPEQDDGETSPRHPPKLTPNDRGAPVQDSTQAPDDVPVLPANAHGQDVVNPNVPGKIDDESMYDRRPGEDKDRDERDMP
jgi:hypothetical protein